MQGLFSGNQNIYFLWGMAELLPNTFAAEPLLASPDPYPLFSWLISVFPVQLLGIWTTVLYVLLSSIYTFSVFGIADQLADIYRFRSRLFSFSAFFLFLHSSPIWGTYFKLVFDADLRWAWDSGIAEQGVLRGYLQPSVFGVFLLLSFYFASRRNFIAAILFIAPAAMMHASYLFLGGILALIYLVQARFKLKTIIASVLLLLVVLPYSIYLLQNFLLLRPETKTAIDQAVMAGFETNPHINLNNWVNPKFYLQLVVMILGIITIWNTRFRKLFLSILGVAILLTAAAYALENTTLISLNPWRFSIVLIPISITVLTANFLSSGIWNLIRPMAFATFGSICAMLVYYRLFGNSSDEYQQRWAMIHAALSFATVVFAMLLSKKEWFSKMIEPLLVMALLILGATEIFIHRRTTSNSEQFQAISKLKGIEPNTLYIIPADWTAFRLNAQKAVFVDENLVYGPALPSLMGRLKMVQTATQANDHSEILYSVPIGMTVKLISPRREQTKQHISSESLTETYSCYVLRQ